MTPKAISFTPEVLKAKLRALEEYGICQTRRPIRTNTPSKRPVARVAALMDDGRAWVEPGGWVKATFGKGQALWIRERARVLKVRGPAERLQVLLRYDDGGKSEWLPYPSRLKPPKEGRCAPNGVFREGARHFLEVVEVRAEMVTEISADDAMLEGVEPVIHHDATGRDVVRWRDYEDLSGNGTSAYMTPIGSFQSLWDSIYGTGAHSRDWCWVYTLKRAQP